MLCSFIYIKYETEALELSHKPEFFSNHLMRGAHLLFEFLRKDSLFCCSFLVFQLSCHLGGERIHKARLPTSTTHFPVQVACPHPLYQKTKRNSQDQDSEAMTNLRALPGTRSARVHFLWTVRGWPAQTISPNIYNFLSQYQQWMGEVIMDKPQ